jgi:AraC-like DNA-binding protein
MEDGFFVSRLLRMSAIKAYIVAKIDDPALCLADIAAHQSISSSYVRKLFAAEGAKFTTYVLELRLEKVASMLSDPDARIHSISAVALKCGFNDISYFNRVFRKRYGCTPSAWRSGRRAPDLAAGCCGVETSGQP